MKKTTLILTALLFITCIAEPATAQEQPKPAGGEPFLKEKGGKKGADTKEESADPKTVINVGTLVQYIDVKREKWQDWLEKNPASLDAGALRKEAEAWIAGGDAKLAETSLIMGKSGQRAKIESNREVFLPTKFESVEGGLPFPTTFDLRNIGVVLEVDPVVTDTAQVDLNYAPERSAYLRENPPIVLQGVESGDIRWPLFSTQRVAGNASLKAEQWTLIACEASVEGNGTNQTLIFTRPIIHQFENPAENPSAKAEGVLTLEWIEVGHGDLNRRLIESDDISALIGGGLRQTALEGGGKIVDTRIVRFMSGQRVKNESVEEVIYPMEFYAADEGQHSNPSKHQTRNIGVTVEVDPVVGKGGGIVDLNISPERVAHFGESIHHRVLIDSKWETDVTMPVFYTMRATTQITVPIDSPVLIGVMSPPDEKGWIESSRKVLLFVKVSR